MSNLVYTRPIKRGTLLQDKISQTGLNVINIPCIEFEYDFKNISKLKNIEHFDYYIFPSITSIESVFHYLERNKLNKNFLNNKAITIGKGSYRKLVQYNIKNPIFPKTGTASEDLLKLQTFHNLDNKKILLFRGDISREYINKILKTRHADFKEVIVYKTVKSQNLNDDIKKLNNINLSDTNIILFTSKSIIDFFLNTSNTELEKHILNQLKNFIIIVPSDRLEKYAKSKGFSLVYNSNQMTDSAILNTLRKINNTQY